MRRSHILLSTGSVARRTRKRTNYFYIEALASLKSGALHCGVLGNFSFCPRVAALLAAVGMNARVRLGFEPPGRHSKDLSQGGKSAIDHRL
jgi:hypothetical protein